MNAICKNADCGNAGAKMIWILQQKVARSEKGASQRSKRIKTI
jgi:hypothetical protein